jgi:hypothetical protein
LEPISKNFLKIYKPKEILEKNESKQMKLPKNFDELILSREAYKLFSNFVSDNFGGNYIECFNHLLYLEKQDQNDLIGIKFLNIKILDTYCKLNSIKLCIFNSKIRDQIWFSGQAQLDWSSVLYKYLYKILSYEYYSRFVNTMVWKDYVNSNFTKEKDCKFDELYYVKKIEHENQCFSETVQILSVVNKLTLEPFTAKRIISTKSISKTEAIQYLDNIPHDNVVQLIELFNEDLESYNKSCLTIVTTQLAITLEDFMSQKLNHHLLEIVILFISNKKQGIGGLHETNSNGASTLPQAKDLF